MNATSTTRLRVETGGEGVVAHAGLHCLGRFADRLGLADLLSAGIAVASERLAVHDRGKVLVQAMLMMAGGGEACSDIEKLRAQPGLFGAVPSDSTLYRTFFQLDASTVAGLWQAKAQARTKVWSRAAATSGQGRVVLDVDASLHQIHSENKEMTGPTYKGGFGFHPVYCFADATGETLAVRLRPGNAGPTTSSIWSQWSIKPSPASRRRSPPAIMSATTRPWWPARSRCAPTRPPAGASRWPVGPAVSVSPWWPARTSRSTLRSAGSPTTVSSGSRPSAKTAGCAKVLRSSRSPGWSTWPTGHPGPG